MAEEMTDDEYGRVIGVERDDEPDDLIGELAARGIIPPKRPGVLAKIKGVVSVPFTLLSRVFSFLAWHLYGKRRHEKAVRKGFEKWQRNAGLAKNPNQTQGSSLATISRALNHEQSVCIDAQAQAMHDEAIRKIVPPPLPDVDDTGLDLPPEGR